ncbi:MAG: hypothetical protein IEMM0002_0424 [bacterium]|nr:MAG: hypothetical protein IEMM0002_0424 [bacterium]
MSSFRLAIFGVSFVLIFAVAAIAEDIDGYTIGEIKIIRHNIFDLSKPEESSKVGVWGNRLHSLTKEKVIRQELLFKEGDPYNKKLVEESERNLRRYKFLTDIMITAAPDEKTRTVDILVTTRDQWSLIVGGTFGGTSGNNETGVDAGEINLMGSGQTLMYRIRHDNRGFTQSFGYRDSTWLDTRYVLDLGYNALPYEKRYNFLLEKPFFSLDTKRAQGLSYLVRDYDDPSLSFNSQRLNAFYGFGSGFGDDDIIRTSLKLSYGEQYVNYGIGGTGINADLTTNLDTNLDTNTGSDNADTSGDNTSVNRDNKVGIVTRLLFDPHKYDKATYIAKFREVEDIFLGTTVTLSLAAKLETFGSTDSDVSAGIRLHRNHKVGKRDYFFTLLEMRRNDDFFNKHYALMDMRYYMRWFKYQTIFFRARALYSESEVNRFYLGGDNGLRGFEADEFKGRNRVIMTLEDRIYTYKTMFYGLIEPGFVVFVDVGNTWNDYSGDKLEKLHGGFGVGLRLALLKAPGISLIALDIGHSFEMDRSPVLTFGMEGAF